MHALEIIANSWPFAAMFVAFCAGSVLIYFISAQRRNAKEQREYNIAVARDVTRRD